MKKGIFRFCLLATLLLVFESAQVTAQEQGRIRFGNLKIIPSLALDGVYDDNIFLGNGTPLTPNEQEVSDFITHIVPALYFDYEIKGRGGMRLGYEGDFAFYADRDENDWQNNSGIFDFDYNAPGGLIFGIKEKYTDAEDPFGSAELFGLGRPQTKRWFNDLGTNIGYAFGERAKAFFYYNFFKQDYDTIQDSTQDYKRNEFGAGYQMRILAKTWGFFRYHYGEQDFFTHPPGTGSNESNDADNDWHRVNLGLTWDSGAKFAGELNFGFQWQSYDNPSDPAGQLYDDTDTWIASTQVTYNATENTSLILSISRAVRVTGATTNEFFEDTSIGLRLTQNLMPKLTLLTGLMYMNNDYNLPVNNPRDDDTLMGDIGLDYQVQEWLKAGVGYAYNRRDSNIVTEDYTDNQFTFSVSAVY
ncbi:MAG: outer membrane beta-barrel protein [Deltaproteobacteria bacterium]|nr:outer membrane beta-barrel protein [Deltaproteobacteria bacterium]